MEWWKILLGLLCLFVAFCYQAYQNLSKNLPKPTFNSKEYWGKGKADGYKEDTSIKPFKVDYSEKVRLVMGCCVDSYLSGCFQVISKLSARLDDATGENI